MDEQTHTSEEKRVAQRVCDAIRSGGNGKEDDFVYFSRQMLKAFPNLTTEAIADLFSIAMQATR